MIDLAMPGGRYVVKHEMEAQDLKTRMSHMNDLFRQDNTEQVAESTPRVQETKKKTQEPKEEATMSKQEAKEERSEQDILFENIQQDISNLSVDFDRMKDMMTGVGDGEEVKKLAAENEELKKQIAELKVKADKLDALMSIMGR